MAPSPRGKKKIQKSSKNPPVSSSNLKNHSQPQSNNEIFTVIHSSNFKSKKEPQKIDVKRESGKKKNNSPIPFRRSGRKRISPRAYWCPDRGDALDSDIWQKFKKVFSDISVKKKKKNEASKKRISAK